MKHANKKEEEEKTVFVSSINGIVFDFFSFSFSFYFALFYLSHRRPKTEMNEKEASFVQTYGFFFLLFELHRTSVLHLSLIHI